MHNLTYILQSRMMLTSLLCCMLLQEKGNIMPGTVIDRMICNPFEFDFYLNS